MAQFEIKDAGDLKRINKQLRELADGKAIKKELTDGFRAVLRPLVPEVRAAYKAAPSMGHDSMARGSRGRADLRVLLAKATKIEVKLTGKAAGARIRVDGRRLPDRMKSLARTWEGEGRPWRHPVYGRRDTWVQQKSRKTFYPIVQRHEVQARRAVEQVLAQVKAKLERAV
ncbi:MAG TPA: hypothetical protein VGJ95_08905 [Pseudonocardiaceae bacterium]|jgi:hypothetical protein